MMQPFYVKNATSVANEASRVVTDSEARLFGCTGYNAGAEQYIQFHDAASLPDDGAVPEVVFKASAASSFSPDYGDIGRHFKIGIVVCNSSTQATKTIGSANCFFDVQYRNAD
jgi:hypothetical protein